MIRRIGSHLKRRFLHRDRGTVTWESYAQEGEDLILAGFFGGLIGMRPGFFVDVGAHHPWRLSNTYFFYIRGWTGINIDAMPGSMREFDAHRPKDINIEVAIGDNPGDVVLNLFESSLL